MLTTNFFNFKAIPWFRDAFLLSMIVLYHNATIAQNFEVEIDHYKTNVPALHCWDAIFRGLPFKKDSYDTCDKVALRFFQNAVSWSYCAKKNERIIDFDKYAANLVPGGKVAPSRVLYLDGKGLKNPIDPDLQTTNEDQLASEMEIKKDLVAKVVTGIKKKVGKLFDETDMKDTIVDVANCGKIEITITMSTLADNWPENKSYTFTIHSSGNCNCQKPQYINTIGLSKWSVDASVVITFYKPEERTRESAHGTKIYTATIIPYSISNPRYSVYSTCCYPEDVHRSAPEPKKDTPTSENLEPSGVEVVTVTPVDEFSVSKQKDSSRVNKTNDEDSARNKIGVSGGIGYNPYKFKDKTPPGKTDMLKGAGFELGIFGEHPLNDQFSVTGQLRLLDFVQSGHSATTTSTYLGIQTTTTGTTNYRFYQMGVDAIANWNCIGPLTVSAGPAITFNLVSQYRSFGTITQINNGVSTMSDYGKKTFSKITTEKANVQLGLNIAAAYAFTKSLQLFINYRLPFNSTLKVNNTTDKLTCIVAGFHFSINWGGKTASFSEVKGMEREQTPVEYRTGKEEQLRKIK